MLRRPETVRTWGDMIESIFSRCVHEYIKENNVSDKEIQDLIKLVSSPENKKAFLMSKINFPRAYLFFNYGQLFDDTAIAAFFLGVVKPDHLCEVKTKLTEEKWQEIFRQHSAGKNTPQSLPHGSRG